MEDIIDYLSSNDLETLLGIIVDKRNEEELKKYSDLLLSQIDFPEIDDPIQEIKRK